MAEIILPIQFSFVTHAHSLAEVKQVYAQFVAKGQCSEYLENLEHVQIVTTESNIESLNTLKNGTQSCAAIVPSDAFKPNEFATVIENVNDYKNNQTRFLLTQRASYNGTHSAQISFPGGKVEDKDINLQETALRETFEEVGIEEKHITIIRKITDVFIPPSNFLATPFIGFSTTKPIIKINHEVDHTFDVKLSDLLNDENISIINITTSYANKIDVPCFKLNNYIVWGATAMILNEIKELLK